MRTIHKLLTGLLLLSGVSFAAHAQNPTWGESITKESFISRAGQAQQDEGSTSTTGFNKGDFFIVLLDTSFFPEYYGAYATDANHTGTGVNTTRFLDKAAADGAITKTTSYGQTKYNGNASPYLFNKSVSQVYKLKPLNVTVKHKVKHRRKAHYTNDEYEKNPGKLYAYNGTLSRFIFVERNKQYAFTGGSDSPYNPYKRKNNDTDHLTPSGDAGFCEYGIDPQDLSTNQTSQKRAITSDWEAAFGSTTVRPLEAYLSENFNAWNEYGVFAFTHDCSGGTWRSHFMHTNIPKVEVDIPNSGSASDAQCEAFTASITPTQNNTILVFVPQKPTAPQRPGDTSDWVANQADSGTDYGIVPKHAPYIQFYLGQFYPKNEATDVVLHENDNYVTHKFAWFTNVYDKYNRDETGTSTTNPNYKQGIEEFKVYARVQGSGDEWQLIETSKVRPHTNAHEIEQRSFIGVPDGEFLKRKSFTYNMEYKVESTIVDLGVSTTIQTLVLPVPALAGEKGLNLTVFSSSRAVDNVGRTPEDSGDSFGTNHITHKLTIIPTGINEVEGDTYTVTRKWDTAKDVYGNEQTIKITINASGEPEITEGKPEGASWTVTKEASTGYIILTLTEIRTADYEKDYRNCDKYMVSYTGATQDVTPSEYKVADYYTVDEYKAEAVLYTESGGKYHYFDRVTFTQVNYGQWRYLLREGDNTDGTGTQWTQETYHDAASTDPNPVEIITERNTTTAPPATLFHTGYLVFSDIDGRGTWGVGTRKTAHDNTSTVVCSIIPHNQVVEVLKGTTGHDQTNPIWNYPASTEHPGTTTMQIFPGVDFDITASKFYEYKVAFGLVLYTKNSNGQWERTIADGKQYFNKITAAGEENDNGIVIPKFDKSGLFDVPEGGKTITQNVVFDFQGTDCKYDAFAFYVIDKGEDAGTVVAYAHSGSALIKAHGAKYLTEEEAQAEGKSGKTNLYYGSQLYVNGLSNVVGENVEFDNNRQTSDGNKYKTIDASTGPVRDCCYYQGNPKNTYDGFAYVVLDLDKVIPTTDVNFERGGRSEDLLPAITSYKITAYQPGNEIPVSEPATTLEGDEAESEEEAESGDEETEPVKKGLHVFYPTIGYYPEKGTASFFDITNYDTTPAKKEIVGTAPGLNWNVTPTDEMQVYADITLNASTATSKYDVNIVEGVHPTPAPETTTTSTSITNRLESTGNNCVLIGLRYIDKTTVGDLQNAGGHSSAPRREGFYEKDLTDLANDITLFIEPEYTIVCPEKPVYSFGGSYQRTTKPTYVSDVMTPEEEQQSGGQGAPAKAETQAKNQIPVIGNPNASATSFMDYLTRKIIDIRENLKETINREQPVYMPSGGQILGVDDVKGDDNVKVFADGRDIVVEGAEGEVIVFNAYGQSVYAGHSSRIAMAQPGVYLVAANGSIYKVFVK